MIGELSHIALAQLLFLSIVFGFFAGALYDIFRIRRIALKIPILWHFEDFFFMVFCGAVYSLLFYALNSGRVRGFAFAGGIVGLLFGKLIKENIQDALTKTCGISTLFIAIGGVLEKMLSVSENGRLVASGSMLIVICLALGTLLGEIINIERGFERFGEWLKQKTGNAKDQSFVNGFVTASLTVCIGAMAIVGSIKDGIEKDPSILITKAILDLIIIAVMTCAMGKGCIFSLIPVGILQGGVTLLAGFLSPLMTQAALDNLSLVGSVLIFCVGINLVFDKKLRIANMLPAIVFAAIAAFLPI